MILPDSKNIVVVSPLAPNNGNELKQEIAWLVASSCGLEVQGVNSVSKWTNLPALLFTFHSKLS
jgi:hypothetical protein